MAFSQLSSGQFETQLGYVKPRLSIITSDEIASLNFAGIAKDFGVSLFLARGITKLPKDLIKFQQNN